LIRVKLALACICIVGLLFTGCSTPVSVNQNKMNTGTIKEAATDAVEMLKEGPGKYAGSTFNEQAVLEELKKAPDNMTGKEAYNLLVSLLAEDYRPIVKKLDEFDTTYEITHETPGDLKGPDGRKKTLNVEILLDSSGSMAGKVNGGIKMDLAKSAVLRFASSLPKNANVSLRVYGHKGSNAKKDKQLSCQSSEQVYPFSPYDQEKFQTALNQFKPTGWTPIASALQAAKEDLEQLDATESIVYVVSDGVETCGGNPVEAAKALNHAKIKAVVNIIGFDVDDAGQKALKEVAKSGGGEYETVDDEKELRRYFDRQQTKLRLAWFDWRVDVSLDLRSQYLKKREQLRQLLFSGYGEFDKQVELERERMMWALRELKELGKLSLREKDEARKLLDQREEQFDQYRKSRFEALDDLLLENRNELMDLAKEKSRQMREKYKNN
jgi:Ca-activated chloride channel family protein